ncbi:MAG: hypothetical protein JRJ08_02265 [Deltaproteobacteria bacterium]|nr:hypothetical protein [Deltaproteobacteria bacterium]
MIFYRKFLIFFYICSVVIFPRILSAEMSADIQKKFDGYWWKEIPLEFQLGFILGYQEGFKMALGELIARNRSFPGSLENLSLKNLERQFHLQSPFECGKIAQEIDKLYEEEANKTIYIYSAINIALMKIKPEPMENIRKAIIQHRKAKELFEKESTSKGVGDHNKPD